MEKIYLRLTGYELLLLNVAIGLCFIVELKETFLNESNSLQLD